MKNYLHTSRAHHLFKVVLSCGLLFSLPVLADPVVLATSPLVNSSSSVVKPNLMLMLDDSGSMAWDYMPDAAKNFDGKYGYYSSQCNGVYYNPTTTYHPPVYADGTSYPNSSFTAAWDDGYNTGAGTTNLSTSFTGGSGSGSSGSSIAATPAFYYTYSGSQLTAAQQDYFDTASTFYTECNTNALTAGIPNSGNVTFTKVTVSTTSGPGSTDERTNFANWYSYYSHRMLMMKTGVGQAFKTVDNRFRLGFMSLNNNASPSFANLADFDATQKGIWYGKLYGASTGSSTPLREALSKIGNYYAYKFAGSTTYTATITVGGSGSTSVSSVTVGGVNIMDTGATSGSTSTSTVAQRIADKIDQKNNSPYTTTKTGSVVTVIGPASAVGLTPVITQSGGMTITATAFVAHVSPPSLNGVTPTDPMQYSCQKNFVILSTDGYWNGNAGYKLDGSAIGNQDGTSPRPYLDGATPVKIVATLRWETKQQNQTGALQWATTQQATSNTLTWATKEQAQTGALQWTTNLQKTTAKLMKSTLSGTYTRTRGVMQVSNNGTSSWVNASTNTTYTCITSGTGSGTTKYCRVPTTSDSTGQASCTVTFNNPGSTTTDGSRRVITACTPEWSTPANVGNNGTCVASATVQCSTGTASTAYITTYPPACTVNFNVAGSNTADASGNVTTNCTVNASYNPTKTSVGAGSTCDGTLANIQCSNAGTTAYLAYGASCTSTFNASGSSTANGSGNVTTCLPPSATFGPTTNLTAGQTCAGGGNIQCGTTASATAYVTTYPGTCTTSYNGATGTSTANASGKVISACPVAGSFNTTKTSVGAGGTCDGTLANMQCSNAGTVAYVTYIAPNCTATFNASGSSTANGSGNVTSCPVNASFGGTTNLTAGQTCTGGGNVQCTTGTTSSVATTACAISYNGLSGTSTADASGQVTTGCTSSGGTSNTLADTAMYYYQTDLRDATLSNCTGASPPALDVCDNNVPPSGIDTNEQQHLTTYGLGLGARGKMVFSSSYLTDASGDFYDVKMGTTATTGICSWQTSGACNWPDPGTGGSPTTIDDLWHAAVNGRGNYFNATNPDSLAAGLNATLSSITQVVGSAAAAATSTLNPVEHNNYAYLASYTTSKWTGNLERRQIDVTTGVMLTDTTWCVENIAPSTCGAGNVIISDAGNHYCSPPAIDANADTVIDAADCTLPRVFDSVSSTCRNAVDDLFNITCTGTLPGRVGVSPAVSPTASCDPLKPTDCDTRKIFAADSLGTGLVSFDTAYATANPDNFSETHIASLSQWAGLTAAQKTAASTNLINFLRGRHNYEENRNANPTTDWLYRYREGVLGDVLESQPVFVGAPAFNYPDAGYASFKSANALRAKTVFVGANDGMLHAFDADTGDERWAFVPSAVIPNMYKLADKNYNGQHVNFINGSAAISDICPNAPGTTCSASEWKTILVGGLNAGGRGYYALDITDPANPDLLWEFTAADDSNLGYSFGKPVIAKKVDGTWVVVVTSGYDNGTLSPDNTTSNSPTGDGLGHLYVLNANTGVIISDLVTTAGSTATPSGLAKFNIQNDTPGGDLSVNSLAGFAYAGDLEGNVWRFDINTAVTADKVKLLAQLYSDTSGTVPQPITVAPTIGLIQGNRVIFVGTGKYLEAGDLSVTQRQSLYAFKDDGTTLVNPRNTLVEKTLTNSGSTRSTTDTNIVNFSTDRGWFVDFPDTGERTNIDFLLIRGVLVAPTIVPSNTACSPGGYGWFNYFNYETGVGAADKYIAPIVGVNVVYNSSGVPIFSAVLATGQVSSGLDLGIPPPTASGFQKVRSGWRELIPE